MTSRFVRLGIVASLLLAAFFAGRVSVTVPKSPVVSLSLSPQSAAPPHSDFPSDDDKGSRLIPESSEEKTALTEKQLKTQLQQIAGAPSSGKQRDDMLQMLTTWAELNPDAALDYVRQEIKSPERQNQAMALVLSGLAKVNPQAAWEWVFTNSPENIQNIDAVLNQVAQGDANSAWDFAQQYAQKYPAQAEYAYVGALRGMGYAGNYQEAANFLTQANLVSSNGNFNLANLVLSEWGRFKPEDAAAWVQTLPAGTERDRSLVQLGGAWAEANPNGAADFAVQLPASQRGAVLTEVVGHWLSSDPAAAAQWVSQFSAHPDMDQVVAELATLPSITDRSTALAWASTITSPELRVQSLTRVYQMWMISDPEAAQANLLTNTKIPLDMRNQVNVRLHRSLPDDSTP